MENRDTNLLSIINPSLEVVYYSTILSNHGSIRIKRFVSQLTRGLWDEFCQLSTFNTPN